MAENDTQTPDPGNSGDGNNGVQTLLNGDDTQPAASGNDTLEGGASSEGNGNEGYWPDDWRNNLAGDDEKLQKRLERFGSPKDVLNSWRAMEQKLSSGDVKATLPDDASDDEIAAYRKDHDIPDKPEGYLDSLPDGLVIGEEDQELAGSFLEAAHASHMPPQFVGQALNWYNQMQEDQAAAHSQEDKQYQQKSEDELRSEWGAEFRTNLNSIKSFLDAAPETASGDKLGDLLMGARLTDGSPLGNNPDAMRWLLQLANEANPSGFVAPGEGLGQIESVEQEIKKIEKLMRTDRPAYNKDEKMQARYRQLLGAREKLSAN